jgi:hypothetical protein
MTVLHVPGQVEAGTFEWPLSERKPSGFKDVDMDNETIKLQVRNFPEPSSLVLSSLECSDTKVYEP